MKAKYLSLPLQIKLSFARNSIYYDDGLVPTCKIQLTFFFF